MNNRACKGNKVACNTIGLIADKPLCVVKAPIEKLTSRCMEELGGRLEKLEVDFFDRFTYDEWAEKFKAIVTELENKKVGDGNQTFAEYCGDNGGARANQQAAECKAMQDLINIANKTIPELQSKVEQAIKDKRQTCSPGKGEDRRDISQCATCAIMQIKPRDHQGNHMAKPATKYLKLLEIMAVQCADKGDQAEFAEDHLNKEQRVAQYIAALGSCTSFGEEDEDFNKFLSKHYKDLASGRKSLDDVFSGDFEGAFGMYKDDAKKAFCGNKTKVDFSKPSAVKNNFNAQMKSNRRRNRATKSRKKKGWMQCDTELQLAQGQPYVEGIDKETARRMAKMYEQRSSHYNPPLSIGTKGPADTEIDYSKKERRKWDMMASGMLHKNISIASFKDVGNDKLSPQLSDQILFYCGGNPPSVTKEIKEEVFRDERSRSQR